MAPVALAWQRAMAERPDLGLYLWDKIHQDMCGGYLAAIVVYATVLGKSPIGLASVPLGVMEDEAAFLQRIAWETIDAYQTQE